MTHLIRQWADRLNVEPRKLVTIGALAIVLVVVCLVQWYRLSGTSSPTLATTQTTLANSPRTAGPSPNQVSTSGWRPPAADRRQPAPASEPLAESGEKPSVPNEPPSEAALPAESLFPVGRVVRFDPFATAENGVEDQESLSAEAENTDLLGNADQSHLAANKDLPVVVDQIVIGPSGATARIGNAWLHVGDPWNGFIVQEIRRDGVVLSVE